MPTLDLSLGRYQLLQEIRRTSDWVLYEAYDTTEKRLAAVWELLLPDLLPAAERQEWVARFQDEAKRFAALEHPNLPHVFEVGSETARPYLAMEFVDGQSLRRAVQARGPIPVKQALEISIQTASALAAIHGRGLLHRAVKPDNILLMTDGTVKLTGLDYGRPPGIPTSSPYNAPEVLRGQFTPRSDVYSLAVTLGEVLTGHKPLPGGKHPTELPPGTTPALRAALRRAWAADPSDRFASATEFAGAVFEEIETADSAPSPPPDTTPAPPAPAAPIPPVSAAPREPQAADPKAEARAAAYRDWMTHMVTKATEEEVAKEKKYKQKSNAKWRAYLPWVILSTSLIVLGCLIHIASQPTGPDPLADIKKKAKAKEERMKHMTRQQKLRMQDQ